MTTLNVGAIAEDRNVKKIRAHSADNTNNLIDWDKRRQNIPHIVKYMGAKRQILDFVVDGIKEVYTGGQMCDLFAGTAVLSGALASVLPIHSNDIQEYSGVMANLYFSHMSLDGEDICDTIVAESQKHYINLKMACDLELVDYDSFLSRDQFLKLEAEHRNLLKKDFGKVKSHLFTKNYSGTYWSMDQCIWIDSIVEASNRFKGSALHNQVIASLMYAMSYSAQSTGHFAQYRDAATEESFNDIIKYRRKKLVDLFRIKFIELSNMVPSEIRSHVSTSMDYQDCLRYIPRGGVVYADPPYGAVHYSRFYHALETLVKYDYPQVKFKGRYRTDRHQSPFCSKSKVKTAFQGILNGVKEKGTSLVLSYSDNGMISLDNLLTLCNDELKLTHHIVCNEIDYIHSTMGRLDDKKREVKECLILARKK